MASWSSAYALGTVHFLRDRGGWWDLGGGHAKKYGFKGGAAPKKKKERGGGSGEILR